jgi:hypothetical protein
VIAKPSKDMVGPVASSRKQRKPSWFARAALERGLASGGCLVCSSLRQVARRYIFSFLYEGMMSGSARAQFLEGGGFCREHFWQAKAIETECWADGFGLAILCENLLARTLNDVERLPNAKHAKKTFIFGIEKPSNGTPAKCGVIPGSGCTVCVTLKESENHYLVVLQNLLEEAQFSQQYQRSPGLCFYHLRASAQQWSSAAALTLVRSTASKVVRQLIADLREFQRKHDYQFRHEPRGAESASPERALDFLVGPRTEFAGFADLVPARKHDR